MELDLLNGLFREAVDLYGLDWKRVVNYVKGRIEALDPAERDAVGCAFEQMLASRSPDLRDERLN
jgi:hypothetical protein